MSGVIIKELGKQTIISELDTHKFLALYQTKRNGIDYLVGWLVGCVLWHIKPCRLFNTKSFKCNCFPPEEVSIAPVGEIDIVWICKIEKNSFLSPL